jgi:predicted phage tail protein
MRRTRCLVLQDTSVETQGTIDRARAFAAEGNNRAALELLKAAAVADRPPFVARRALAELYRELRCPDQAGRWGIMLGDWTTALERDRLARMIVTQRIPRRWAYAFLACPADVAIPDEVVHLLDVTVPSLRSEMNARLSRQRSMTPSGDAASALAGMVALIGLIFSPVALLLVFAITVAHIGDPRLWTAGVGGLMALAFGVAALAAGTAGLLEKRPRSGVLWAVVGGALVALGVVGLVSAFT